MKATKLALAARTVLNTNFRAWQTARLACRSAANQKWSELSRLIHFLRGRELTRVLEIGVSAGGTLALWAQFAADDACLIGLDLRIAPSAKHIVNSKRTANQAVHFIEGDSHSETTKALVRKYLGDRPLDLLFIDGDHSYEGVKRDWEMYSPLVQCGGLVAFHDIVPDHRTRFGLKTPSDSGGVYKLWRGVKENFPHYEFIEHPDQDGFGIGVLLV